MREMLQLIASKTRVELCRVTKLDVMGKSYREIVHVVYIQKYPHSPYIEIETIYSKTEVRSWMIEDEHEKDATGGINTMYEGSPNSWLVVCLEPGTLPQAPTTCTSGAAGACIFPRCMHGTIPCSPLPHCHCCHHRSTKLERMRTTAIYYHIMVVESDGMAFLNFSWGNWYNYLVWCNSL